VAYQATTTIASCVLMMVDGNAANGGSRAEGLSKRMAVFAASGTTTPAECTSSALLE
jgi:hypothetical protein